ncbi:MAG TPA: hypothetical protein VKP14_06205 [Gaiellaceae bacterium]|nr:hypothetical protein [Gaiellaceae bacterium]
MLVVDATTSRPDAGDRRFEEALELFDTCAIELVRMAGDLAAMQASASPVHDLLLDQRHELMNVFGSHAASRQSLIAAVRRRQQ